MMKQRGITAPTYDAPEAMMAVSAMARRTTGLCVS